MKRSKKWFNSVAMLAMLIGFNATSNAEINVVIAGDTTGEGNGNDESVVRRASLLADTASDYVINIVPSAGPPLFASSFPQYAVAALTKLYNTGTLPVGMWSGAEDPRMLTYFSPDDLMVSPVLPFWERTFSPNAPNQNERGRTIVVWIMVSKPGGKVSLDQVNVHLRSSEGTLNKDTSFGGRAYSQYAWGIDKSTQTIIKAGNADTAYPMVMVGDLMNYYEVKTSADVNEVITYIDQWQRTGEGFDLDFNVQVGGSVASKRLYLTPPVVADNHIKLAVTAQGNGQVTVMLVGLPANSTHRFKIQTTSLGGAFQDFQDIGYGNVVVLPKGNQFFVRLRP